MRKSTLIFILLFYGFTLTIVDVSAAAADRMVKVVYFVPRDRPFQWNIPTALDTRIKAVQRFYAEQMEAHGHSKKTFNLENDAGGKLIVHPVTGNFNDAYYHTDTLSKITDEIDDRYNIEKDIYIVIVDVSTERIQGNCGIAYFDGGPVMVAATGDCVQGDQGVDLIAHELGHALNLEHDFRNESYIMSYGATRDQLSACAAAMLNVSPFFNNVGNTSNAPAIIQMLTPTTYPANEENWAMRFSVSDADGVYQVQFLLSIPGEATSLSSCQNFKNTQSATVEFDMPEGATVAPINNVLIRVVDPNGYITAKDWTLSATKTTGAERTETYLTLTYDNPDALVPINNSAEWGWDWGGWPAVWEKKPNGSIPPKPHQGFVSVGHIPYINQWDYWFYAHAVSRTVYDLKGGNYAKFDAYFDMPNPCGTIASVKVICLADNVEIYNSGILRGNQARNTPISIDIPENSETFTIRVTNGEDDASCDHFIIANARLLHREPPVIKAIDSDRTETYLTLNYDSPDALVPTNSSSEWAGWREKLVWEKTPDGLLPRKPQGFMDPKGYTAFLNEWDHWFYAHALSRIIYNLDGRNYTEFDGYFFMPNPCGSIASVEVICFADGVEVYNSGLLRAAQAQNIPISFDIPAGTQKLTIRVTDAGDGDGCDHFIIANARLLHGETPVIETDDYDNNHTDVNSDGIVNIVDLVLVAARYGEKVAGNPHPNPDVNRDGIVDVDDIILITKDMPPVAGAPALQNIDWQYVYNVLPDVVIEKGIVVLDLLFGTAAPTKTMLLENYPNPFNPETWIPYQLAKTADVVITIHAVDGQIIRKLDLGHRNAGSYVSHNHAAYWDGKNGLGEPVASGIYFYTLTAGKFAATRRMLIRK